MPYILLNEEDQVPVQPITQPKSKPKKQLSVNEYLESQQEEPFLRSKPVGVPENESYGQQTLRSITGALSSGAAGFGGVPANILELISSIRGRGQDIAQRGAAQEGLEFEKSPGEKAIDYLQQGLKSVLPTTESLKGRLAEYLPEKYLEPKGEAEKTAYKFAEDVGSLLFPLGGATKASKAVKIAGAGNVAKFLSQKLGAGEGISEGVKTGTMLLTSLGLQDSLKKRASDMYGKVEELVSPTATINAEPLRDTIKNIEKKFSGIGNLEVPSKKAVNNVLASMEKVIAGDRVSIKDLIAFKQDMGESLAEAFKYPRATPYLTEIAQDINKAIKSNPEIPKEIANLLTNADQIWSGLSQSNKAVNFIKETPQIANKLGGGTLGLIGLITSPVETIKKVGGAAIAGATALGGTAGGYAIKNYFTNQSIRTEYSKMMAAALKESIPGVIKHGKKLDKEIKAVNENKPKGKWILMN